jgi:predicted nucleic acid-binding protein
MNPAFVMDCSIAMTWLFADERTAATDALQDRLAAEAALVPALWHLEIANVLTMAERKGRITSEDAVLFTRLLRAFDVETDPGLGLATADALLPLCRAHRLAAYDAAYLELAMRRRLPLATVDKELTVAARGARVEVLGQEN